MHLIFYNAQHVDRYERLQCQQTLKAGTPGVALIEYEDGERELVDLKVEKFRGHRDDESDDERDDDTLDGDDDVNNFNLLVEGGWIEISRRFGRSKYPLSRRT